MTHEDVIALIQAHRDKKRIQYRAKIWDKGAGWANDPTHLFDDDPTSFDFSRFEYRVKPEPREWWIKSYGWELQGDAFTSPEQAKALVGDCVKLIHVREVIE